VGYSTEDPAEAKQGKPRTKIQCPGRREGWASTHIVLLSERCASGTSRGLLNTFHPAVGAQGHAPHPRPRRRGESRLTIQLTIAALTGSPYEGILWLECGPHGSIHSTRFAIAGRYLVGIWFVSWDIHLFQFTLGFCCF